MELKFHTLDVFTETRFGGNPLAVVHGGEGLDTASMQKIAREFNLSETVFVLPAERVAHSARVRIFTPASELPFAGHPTIGTAVLLAEMRALPAGQDALITLEETIGIVRVGVRMRDGAASFAEFDAPKLPVLGGPPPGTEEIAASVGLIPSEIGFANHRPTIFDGGVRFAFIPVASREALERAQANIGAWRPLDEAGASGAFLYCNQPSHRAAHFRARMFAPSQGIMEDPATGAAAVAFAGVVHHFDGMPDGGHRREIEQGYEMGRPSRIALSIDIVGNRLDGVRIGGHAVRVSEGTLIV